MNVQWRAVCLNISWFSLNCLATTASCGSSGSAAASRAWRERRTVRSVIAAALETKWYTNEACYTYHEYVTRCVLSFQTKLQSNTDNLTLCKNLKTIMKSFNVCKSNFKRYNKWVAKYLMLMHINGRELEKITESKKKCRKILPVC